MDTNAKAQKILKELKFDFAAFTMDGFLCHVSAVKSREIITAPWDMPDTLFGAWFTDADVAREYIFYRRNVSEMHQIHIQLHELSHFLHGHETHRITRETIIDAAAGRASLPFAELPLLRSPKLADLETQAETLTSLIQKQVVQHTNLAQLTANLSVEQKFADFLKTMRLT